MKPSLPEAVLLFTGTSGTRLGKEHHENDVEIVAGRGKDQWDKLRIARTNAWNYNLTTDDIIAKLKHFDEKYGTHVFHAETDSTGIKFLSWPQSDEMDRFRQEIRQLCSDIVSQVWNSTEKLEETLEAMGFIHLWWD